MQSGSRRANKWTDEALASLLARAEPWMRQMTSDRFCFHIAGADGMSQVLGVSEPQCRKVVRGLVAAGKVTYRGATYLGYSWVGAPMQKDTLANLLTFAETTVDPLLYVAKGRRSLQVTNLTPSQYKDIKTVANLVARHVPGAEGRLTHVPFSWFGYDESRMRWTLEEHVARWSDDQHREDWETSNADSGKVWSSTLNTGRSKHLGAIRNLLDLAAAHGKLARTASPAMRLRSPASEWQPFMARWHSRILKHFPDASAQVIRLGLRTLAYYATQRRELSPTTTDWLAVRRTIECSLQHAANPRYAVQQRDAARYAWRLATSILTRPSVTGARPRIALDEAFYWPTQQDDRRCLVHNSALNAAARHATPEDVGTRALADRGIPFDYSSTWLTRDGQYVRSFVEGPTGIAAFVTWSTAPEDSLARLGLPERAFIDPPPEMAAGIRRSIGRDKKPYLLRYATLQGRLRTFSELAGFAQLNPELCRVTLGRTYDFANQDDLSSLCDLRLVQIYSEWVREENDDLDDLDASRDVPTGVCLLAKDLAKVASPFIEGVFRIESARQFAAGQADAGAALLMRADEFRKRGAELKAWGYKHQPRAATEKDIEEINKAWAWDGPLTGWEKLDVLVDLLLADAESAAGVTISEQLARIREAASLPPSERCKSLSWQTASWATAVRAAMLVNFVRKIPVRARALSEMRLDWWWACDKGRRVEAWHPLSDIIVRIPGVAMKTRERKYEAAYINQRVVGDHDHEAGARRPLIELYLHPLGARAFLLTADRTRATSADGRGIASSSPYFFPPAYGDRRPRNSARSDSSRQDVHRWSAPALSVTFEAVVRKHAAALGLNLEMLTRIHGALRIHVARLLFGHHNGPISMADTALMLHHADISITARLYVGRTGADATFERRRTVSAGAGQATSSYSMSHQNSAPQNDAIRALASSLEEQRRHNMELSEQVKALTIALRTSGQHAA